MAIKKRCVEYTICNGGLTVVIRPEDEGTFIEQRYTDGCDRVYVEHPEQLADLVDVLVEIQNGHE